MTRNGGILRNLDWWTVLMFLALAIFGWMNIYGASYNFDQTSIFDFSNRAGKQFVWILGSIAMGGILLIIDYKVYDVLAYVFYGAMLLLLLATPLLAHDIKGSMSWISLGPVSLQPAEFAKCVTALAVAKYMGQYGIRFRSWRDWIVPFALIGVPMFIIMVLQKETGSALVFVAFALVFYRQGMSGYVLLCGVAVVALFIMAIRWGQTPLPLGSGSVGVLLCMILLIAVMLYFLLKEKKQQHALILSGGILAGYAVAGVLSIWLPVNFDYVSFFLVGAGAVYIAVISFIYRVWPMYLVVAFTICCMGFTQACNFVFLNVLQPHQRDRIEVLFGMKDDPSGVGYNVIQSKIAIGSGRFLGKGFLQGTQTKLKFVPEQDTDFIFCTVGEEWGFLGSCGVLILYLAFILRIISLAERQRDTFSQIYAYSVASIFLMHLMINVGMVLGLLPVIGIPLPMFSYGGSSLWGFTILLAILLRLDAARVEKLR